jgi:hypothetical protein
LLHNKKDKHKRDKQMINLKANVKIDKSNPLSSLSNDELIDLSTEEQKLISGGANCTYADQQYSPGAVVAGQVCGDDGYWHSK